MSHWEIWTDGKQLKLYEVYDGVYTERSSQQLQGNPVAVRLDEKPSKNVRIEPDGRHTMYFEKPFEEPNANA